MTVLLQAVGFGPASLGIPLAADRLGVLDILQAEGMTIIEKAADPGTVCESRLDYKIESNSPGADFLTSIAPQGNFGTVLRRPAAMSIASSGSCRVPLEKVTQLMADLSDEITRWVSAGRGEIRYGTEVAAVRRNADSTFTTMDAVGNVLATSRTVVLGTGASEEVDDTGSMSPVMASGQLLSGDFAAVDEAVRANRTIAIVGTSHSGLSCTDLILQRHQGRLRRGQIILLYRNFSLFYDDLADYQDGLAGPSADLLAKPTVCSETGWINRYGGLRGRARNLCVQILAGNVPEVDLIRSDSAATSTRLIDAGAIVKACGYRGVAPEVQDADGRPVPLARRGGSFWADSACRLVGPSGPIEGLYGLGLGFARCASNGEKRVGINIFHGEDSTDIIQNLQDSVLTGGRSTYTREV